MKYFLFKLLGVLTIGAGGFVAGYSKGVSITTLLVPLLCYFFGQVFYDRAFKYKDEEVK